MQQPDYPAKNWEALELHTSEQKSTGELYFLPWNEKRVWGNGGIGGGGVGGGWPGGGGGGVWGFWGGGGLLWGRGCCCL